MSDLCFYSDDEEQTIPVYPWNWTYAHGDLEADNCHDIGLFNQEKPDMSGVYSGMANGKEFIVRLIFDGKRLEGRAAYISDIPAMQYIYDDTMWG